MAFRASVCPARAERTSARVWYVKTTTTSTGACLDGVCAALATVSGTVTLFENYYGPGTPAAGATVSVHGTSLSTTTDEDGGFSFDVFIGDWFFRASKEDTWGFIELGTVSTTGPNGIGLEVDADAFVAQFEQELKEQGLKIDIDDTKGVIAMDFDRVSYLGGETATLSESYDFAIAFDADGNPVSSEKLLSDGDRVLSFFSRLDGGADRDPHGRRGSEHMQPRQARNGLPSLGEVCDLRASRVHTCPLSVRLVTQGGVP
ncbi:MAG: hypothetical protein JRG67_16760 [Deltaproteobacteria bacterium]|nr:hypothetical protein [Deltaproteobacteria bacterium]